MSCDVMYIIYINLFLFILLHTTFVILSSSYPGPGNLVSMSDCMVNPLVSISLTIFESHWERAFNPAITGTMILILLKRERLSWYQCPHLRRINSSWQHFFLWPPVIQLQWCSSALYSLSLYYIATVGAVGRRCDHIHTNAGCCQRCNRQMWAWEDNKTLLVFQNYLQHTKI